MTTTIDLSDIRLATPPRKRQRGGEWDWWDELSFGRQQSARRWMVPLGTSPDDLATHVGTDIDSACLAWLQAHELESVTGARRTATLANTEHPEKELFRMGDLLGPADIAEALDVKPATIRQWLARGLLPAPVYVNMSGRVRLWSADDIDRWARATGRLSEAFEAEPDF